MELSLKFEKVEKIKTVELNIKNVGDELKNTFRDQLVDKYIHKAKEADIPEILDLPDGLVMARLCMNCKKKCKVEIPTHASFFCPDVALKPISLK